MENKTPGTTLDEGSEPTSTPVAAMGPAATDLSPTVENDADSQQVTGAVAEEPARVPWHRRRWVRRSTAAVVAAILIASVALAGVLGWKLQNKRDVDSATQQAMETAQTYAVTLTSVDSNNIDQNFESVLNGATGEFKDMYSQSSGQLKQLLIDNKAAGHGTVIAAGIKSATKDKVEVMLFVDQTISNTASPDPRVDRSRLVMTMELDDGRWLASKVELP